MTDEQKALIETEVFAWMKANEPTSLEQGYPPWKCVLHVFAQFGREPREDLESADIAREVYLAWKAYKAPKS